MAADGNRPFSSRSMSQHVLQAGCRISVTASRSFDERVDLLVLQAQLPDARCEPASLANAAKSRSLETRVGAKKAVDKTQRTSRPWDSRGRTWNNEAGRDGLDHHETKA